MAEDRIITTTRRGLLELLTGAAGLAAIGLPDSAMAQSRSDTLVIGMDFSDTITYDTSKGTAYTAPMVYEAAYDTLVTMTPGDYTHIKPALASSWARTPDGQGWRFTLRDGAKFNSGNPVTADDVKWSFDRTINMKAQASQYVTNVTDTKVVDDRHFDVILKDPKQPILDILCSPSFSIWERKVLEAHGGVAGPDASSADKATLWLDQNSCGSGAYTITQWQRNISTRLERNPHYWRGTPPFQRVIILHIPEPAVQLLALQRGNIDVAFNLIPEQIDTLQKSNAQQVRIEPLDSLDFIYIALTANPEFSKALSIREARQAIGYAIDYDGIKNNLLGGFALRCASFLPVGILGSTEEVTKEIGFHEDLARSKALLAKAGMPDGFTFKLNYGDALISGVSYAVIAQKIQSDLARVGIKVELEPLNAVTMRTQYNTGRSTAIMVYWNPPAVNNWLWAAATVERVAKRLHWTPPEDIVKLVADANDEPDPDKQAKLWIAYQKRMVEEANLIILFQPVYRVGVSNRLKNFPLTAAGWQADLYAAQA